MVTDAITEALVDKSALRDEGRLNELRTELRMDLRELAERLERGYNVEVRTGELPERSQGEDDPLDPSTRQAAESVLEAQEGIRAMNAVEEPALSLEHPNHSEDAEDQKAEE